MCSSEVIICRTQINLVNDHMLKLSRKSRNFELACLKKKIKEKHFGCLATFQLGSFTIIFHATGYVAHHENLEDEQYVVYRF